MIVYRLSAQAFALLVIACCALFVDVGLAVQLWGSGAGQR